MKKLFALIIALGMFLTLTACVSDNNDQTPETTGKITDNDAEIDTKPESGESENSDSSESTPTGNENDDGEEALARVRHSFAMVTLPPMSIVLCTALIRPVRSSLRWRTSVWVPALKASIMA